MDLPSAIDSRKWVELSFVRHVPVGSEPAGTDTQRAEARWCLEIRWPNSTLGRLGITTKFYCKGFDRMYQRIAICLLFACFVAACGAASPGATAPTTVPAAATIPATTQAVTAAPAAPTAAPSTAQPAPTVAPAAPTAPAVPTTVLAPTEETAVNPTVSSNDAGSANAMIERAKQDLASRAKVDANAITVVSSQAMEWTDSSLGCPQPDTGYMQVITPGYLITLAANGNTYEYHTDTNRTVTFCEQPKQKR